MLSIKNIFFAAVTLCQISVLSATNIDTFNDAFKNGLCTLQTFASLAPSRENIEIQDAGKPGSHTLATYYVTINKQELFAKRVALDSAEREKLQAIQNFLDTYAQDVNPSLPKFTCFLGECRFQDARNSYSILLLSSAPGHSLFDYFSAFPFYDFETPESRTTTLISFQSVGKSIASFHAKYKLSEDNTFKTITHGDLHFSNIYLDERGGITIIDNETLSHAVIEGPKAISIDIWRMFHFSRDGLAPIIKEKAQEAFFRNLTSCFISKEESDQRDAHVAAAIFALDECFNAVATGYNAGLQAAGLNWVLNPSKTDLSRIQ